uniref:PPPDE domain-containing protein n=1 Tax=Kalanchoe fedtschenkoi TaxID=63787 RepID=A0A7N0T9U4_KALFE
MLCRMMSKKHRSGKVPVYLNVYDLTSINGYAYWLGLGAYHSGVQVHGVEYAFGAHDQSSTGVFEVEPRQCPGFTFRKSILIGRTDLDAKQVRAFVEKLSGEYHGNTYNLIAKNCNHFCHDACVRLTGKPIPSWVNRLARLGVFCNCVLPASLNETRVRRVEKVEERGRGTAEEERKKLRSLSNRFGDVDETATFRRSKSSSGASSVRGGRKQSSRCVAAAAPLSSSVLIHNTGGVKC